MNIGEELKKVVSGEVRVDDMTLETFAEDASIFHIKPEVVVAPRDVEDICEIVKWVNARKRDYPEKSKGLSITPRSAGSDMGGGPLSESIVLDMLPHFQGIFELGLHSDKTGWARVLPGTYYRDLKVRATLEGLLLPCYTASKTINTLGGMVANNSGGEKTLAYGKTDRYVEELKIVLADGKEHNFFPLSKKELGIKLKSTDPADAYEQGIFDKLYKLFSTYHKLIKDSRPDVSKNSAGYNIWNVWDGETFDITKLITGSQGTLGIITEVTLRLVRPKEHSTLLAIFLKDFSALPAVVGEVLKHHPESFESYDDHTMKIALKYFPSMLKMIGARNMFKLALDFLPEFWMVLSGGAPKLVLVAEFTGDNEDDVYRKARQAGKAVTNLNIGGVQIHQTKSDEEERKYWTVRRQSFALLRNHVHGRHTAPFIDDLCVRPDKLALFMPRLEKIMQGYDITYTVAGHVGDGNFHIIPLMDYTRPDFRKIIRELAEKVYGLVAEFGGSISGEHNDGVIRTPYLSTMYSPKIMGIFSEIKEIFDPFNIFNIGKKVPGKVEGDLGTLGYALSHIKPK